MKKLSTIENTTCESREISIWLDHYEDIFSDFDESDFHKRLLSDSFLSEVHKLVQEIPCTNLELKFNLMQDQQNPEVEDVIIKNICDYFKTKANSAIKSKNEILNSGKWWVFAGFTLIIVLVILEHHFASFFLRGTGMMLDPLGWFLIWNGFDKIFFQSKKIQPDIDFNIKMTKAKLVFESFNVVIPQMGEDVKAA